MSRLVLTCALGSLILGCRPKVPAFAEPPPHAGPSTTRSPPPPREQPPPPPPPPPPEREGCVVRFSVPTQAEVGTYPGVHITAEPPIPYRGRGPEPTALVTVTAPDGSRDELSIPLVLPPVCAYCLPAPGSGGCEHDCRWDPFVETVASIHLDMPGRHRVSVRLRDCACALEGDRAVVDGVAREP